MNEASMAASYVGGKAASLSGKATLLRFVALDEAMSFVLLEVDDTGSSPLVATGALLFISRLRSAKLEAPGNAEVRELSNWKGETVVLPRLVSA